MKAVWCLLLLALVIAVEAIPTRRNKPTSLNHGPLDSDRNIDKGEGNDMLFTKELKEIIEDTKGRQKRRANNIPTWPNGRVLYEFVDIGDTLVELARKAIAKWSEKTCLEFIEFDPDLNGENDSRIEFVHSDVTTCLSYVGYTGSVQAIWLSASGCNSIGVLLHEIGHAIGMLHEHTRIDRDKYVTINFDNINTAYWQQFNILDTQYDTSVPYDIGSVMHYGPWTFSKNVNNEAYYSIEVNDTDKQHAMGRQQSLSHLDSMFINNIYSCNENCTEAELLQDCKHGGFVGKNCICLCPDGLEGEFCTSLASSQTSSDCGGHFTVNDGTISTPNYPDEYPLETQCYYLIEAPEGYTVELTFGSFLIEEDTGCYWDQLYIRYDGLYFDTSAPVYCGDSLDGRTLTSTVNSMLLDFRSDDWWQETGFTATYTFIAPPTTPPPPTTLYLPEQLSVTATGGCTENTDEEIEGQVITTKNYPSAYPKDSSCKWTITLPDNTFGYLYFERMDVDVYSGYCFDKVKITYGSITTAESKCGQELPDDIAFTGTAVVKFKSGDAYQWTGFKLRYEVLSSAADAWNEWSDWSSCSATCGSASKSRTRTCSGSYCVGLDLQQKSCDLEPCDDQCEPSLKHSQTSTGGIIQSPGYPFQYPKKYFKSATEDCKVVIDVPEGHKVTFSFNDIDLRCCDANCNIAYVKFEQTGQTSIKTCHNVIPGDITFVSGEVNVIFWNANKDIDEGIFARGFYLVYTFTEV